MGDIYLHRYAWPGPAVQDKPDELTGLIVVIPCYNEPEILLALDSLFRCSIPKCNVEVLVVVNHGEHETREIREFNLHSAEKISSWIAAHKKRGIVFHLIEAFELPYKHAGVGLARKIGMDEAVRRFDIIGQAKGIIACFDADCTCDLNYLDSIYTFYNQHPYTNAAVIHFEHPLTGKLAQDIYEGIIIYELHLRYYKNALNYAKFPFNFHTIGSCMTVSVEAYKKQGGMNKRKAGEDFYFLQKIFPLGHCYNISSTTIYPSPRPSNRVPFGTGNAIEKLLRQPGRDYRTYHPNSFKDLKCLMDLVPALYQRELDSIVAALPESIAEFIKQSEFEASMVKIKKNSRSAEAFIKSFFRKFNGFTALKFIHFARDNYYEEMEILEAANWIISEACDNPKKFTDKKGALEQLRALEKSC